MFWFLPIWVNVSLGLWAAFLAILYYYLTCRFGYWKQRGVKYVEGYPVFGSVTFKQHLMITFDNFYKRFEGEKFIGYFQGRQPAIMVMDPELIKTILIKDFSHFTDHGIQVDEDSNPLLAKHLFNLNGQRWKNMRNKLAPTFTSGKIKMMTPLIENVARVFQEHLLTVAKEGEFDVKEHFSKFTTDVIGSCVFGIQCNSLADPKSEFREMGRKMATFDLWRAMKLFIVRFLPEVGKFFRLTLINKEITNFFRRMVREVMELRKTTGTTRRDFIQLLIELKEMGKVSIHDAEEHNEIEADPEKKANPSSNLVKHFDELSHDDLTAQATVFFLAGFETSSTLMTFACLELAVNPDVQKKAQADVDEALAKHGGEFSYDALKDMKYLDCVVQETLRKYPPTGNLLRVCTKNYTLPGTSVHLEKGTPLVIPMYSLQNDPKYFPDPEQFLPERFSAENASQKNQFLHMPFGEGPRQCIGNRFALVQSKMGLASVLSKFDINTSERTSYPVQIEPKNFILSAVGGVWLKVNARDEE